MPTGITQLNPQTAEAFLWAVAVAEDWLLQDENIVHVMQSAFDQPERHPVATPIFDGDDPALLADWLDAHFEAHLHAHSWRYLFRWHRRHVALVVHRPRDTIDPPRVMLFEPAMGRRRGDAGDPLPAVRRAFPSAQRYPNAHPTPCQRAAHDTLDGAWALMFLSSKNSVGCSPVAFQNLLAQLCGWCAVLGFPRLITHLRETVGLSLAVAKDAVDRLKTLSEDNGAELYIRAFYVVARGGVAAPAPGRPWTWGPPDFAGRRCVALSAPDGRCAVRRGGRPAFGGPPCPRSNRQQRLDCLRGACRAHCHDAGIARWLTVARNMDPEAVTRKTSGALRKLIQDLLDSVTSAFPGVPAIAPDDEGWACRGVRVCQWRRGGPRAWPNPCRVVADPVQRLSCALGALRHALHGLFGTNLVRSFEIGRAVATFRHRLQVLLGQQDALLANNPASNLGPLDDQTDSNATDEDSGTDSNDDVTYHLDTENDQRDKGKGKQQDNRDSDDVTVTGTGVNTAIRDQDPLAFELNRLHWVNEDDVAVVRDLHGELDLAVLAAYITILQFHYQEDAVGLCNPLFVTLLDRQAGSMSGAPSPFKPGRVTCMPANTNAKVRKGGHWVLFIVDQRSGPLPTVWLANSMMRVSTSAKVLPGLYSYLTDKLAPLGWDKRVQSAHSPQQREGQPPRRGRGSREPSESNACGLHVLQNMEFVAHHVTGGSDPLDAPWTNLWEAFVKDRVLEPGERRPSMASYREALADAMEVLVECSTHSDRTGCLQAAIRSITPFMYYGP